MTESIFEGGKDAHSDSSLTPTRCSSPPVFSVLSSWIPAAPNMSYYDNAQWPAGGQASWEHQTPPARSGLSLSPALEGSKSALFRNANTSHQARTRLSRVRSLLLSSISSRVRPSSIYRYTTFETRRSSSRCRLRAGHSPPSHAQRSPETMPCRKMTRKLLHTAC